MRWLRWLRRHEPDGAQARAAQATAREQMAQVQATSRSVSAAVSAAYTMARQVEELVVDVERQLRLRSHP